MENAKKELYIPVSTPDSDDFISGIGKHELCIILISVAVGICAGIMISRTYGTLNGLFVGAMVVTLTIVLCRRDQYNENLVKKLKICQQYKKTQKQYCYEQYNIYESRNVEVYDDEDE